MPTYNYQCERCDLSMDLTHSMVDEQPRPCRLCGWPMKRVPVSVPIHLKGEGFSANGPR